MEIPSIKKKITYISYIFFLLIVATAMLTNILVQRVERKVLLVEVLDDFLNMTLELRRFEKNYFLYNNENDYTQNLLFLKNTKEVLDKNTIDLSMLVPSKRIDDVKKLLIYYEDKMKRLHVLNLSLENISSPADRDYLKSTIRKIGQEVTNFAEDTTAIERESIKKLLKTSRTTIIASAGALTIFSVFMMFLLVRKILISLNVLTGYTKKVSQGEMIDPPNSEVEEEIQVLFKAFNRMNNELRMRQSQIVQTEKLASLGTLLAGVAHELNNPLSNISSSAQILAEELGESENDFHLNLINQIENQIDKARDIVKTLLEFSRTRKFNKEKLHFLDLIDETKKLLRSEITDDIKFHVECGNDVALFADKQRLQQVFINLIKNAVDALESTGNIWISAYNITTSNNEKVVEILFEDDGPGIPLDLVQNIFDPFFTTKDVGKGSGLGLSIVHEIIEMHNGEIKVDSRINEGTTFIIWLPVGG